MSVTIPEQEITIEDIDNNSTFETMDDFVATEMIAIDGSTVLELGDPDSHLEFAELVKIQIATDDLDGTSIIITVQHE